MSATNPFLTVLAQNLLYHVPSLLVCLVGCILVMLDWRRGGRASVWALVGFGLVVVLSLVMPVAYAVITTAMMTGGGAPDSQRMVAYSVLSVGGALVHAASYAFLLLAVLSGRAPTSAPPPPKS